MNICLKVKFWCKSEALDNQKLFVHHRFAWVQSFKIDLFVSIPIVMAVILVFISFELPRLQMYYYQLGEQNTWQYILLWEIVVVYFHTQVLL